MMPSGHKAFLVSNVKDVELLLMHNKTYAAEYVTLNPEMEARRHRWQNGMDSMGSSRLTSPSRIAHNVSSRKRIDIIARAKQLGVKVTNAKAKVTTEV
jgi:large subunit ribosomal protein L32e